MARSFPLLALYLYPPTTCDTHFVQFKPTDQQLVIQSGAVTCVKPFPTYMSFVYFVTRHTAWKTKRSFAKLQK